jgi:hypothetical protein
MKPEDPHITQLNNVRTLSPFSKAVFANQNIHKLLDESLASTIILERTVFGVKEDFTLKLKRVNITLSCLRFQS